MLSLGSTPKCPTCDKNVYAAEQVMGPGRKIYHKPCLKCMTCARRLDSLSLLEHNQEPYCKTCHVKNFGTRDLRSANLTLASPPITPMRRTRSPPPMTASDSPTTTPIRRTRSPPPMTASDSPPSSPSAPDGEEATSGDEEADPAQAKTASPERTASLPPTRFSASGSFHTSSLLRHASLQPNFTKTGAATTSRATARPLSPSTTGSSTASAPTYLRSNTTGALKHSNGSNTGAKKTFGPSPGFDGTPICPRCGKAVYFAEQVKASGRTWHKPCLRCTECSSLLDSTRLTEKDGQVICRSCYSKLHGPQGSGYALL